MIRMNDTLLSGAQIGPYRIENLLGQGGMAQVYRAWNVERNRYEALKILPSHMRGREDSVNRFQREARIAARLQHSNIVQIYAVGTDGQVPYFTMELVDGTSLSTLLTVRKRIPLQEVVGILYQVAAALDYAHSKSVIHRDIKASNVLMRFISQGHWDVKVADFGIARSYAPGFTTRLTQTGKVVGTPEYMSPEQIYGQNVAGSSDQYSLAIVAYEALCGQTPFSQGSEDSAETVLSRQIYDPPPHPRVFSPELPTRAANALMRGLSKSPNGRFRSCTDLVKALDCLPNSAKVNPEQRAQSG